MKSRTTAIVLALFLGGIGGHKFYLGRSGAGILYLIFCWTWIPALIALVDLIRLITMDDVTFNQIYNGGLVALPVAAFQNNVVVNNATPVAQPNIVVNVANSASTSSTGDVATQIKSLHELHVAGALTDDEYVEQKRKLLTGTRG